ncbi:MAG: caspase family protein [Hormoscilla sp. GM102CHS1]|nr:caspase family protein [Hormoscilla sp. GM102CHS1]
MKRRDLLQRLGWTMAALGISEAGLSLLGRRYYQALAQPTSRKLALLVGINQYPTAALAGSVTDVELQRLLLIHRFGFSADDILTLTDRQATREQIESAFIEHLIEQAGADDLVVFHFSGYGRQVRQGEVVQNTLVPVDGGSPSPTNPQVNDLLIERLHLLLGTLRTEKVITILDTSYLKVSDEQLVGSLWLRARNDAVLGEPSSEALAVPEKLRQDLWADRAKLQNVSQLPGMVLAAVNPTANPQGTGGKAFEAQWNGFSTGLFTYALTLQLWLATPATTLQVSFSQASGVVEQLASNEEQPRLIGKKSDYLTPNSILGADGVVRGVEEDGKTAQLWLGGLLPHILENYGVNSLLRVLRCPSDSANSAPDFSGTVGHRKSEAQLQLRSCEGLTAKANIKTGDSIVVGQFVQEAIRVLPRSLSLTVGLSAGLERIERVDATSAFSGVDNVKTVAIEKYPQPVDCLFGKVDKGDSLSGVQNSYGLFWPANIPISNTGGSKGEAVKKAVQRLTPQLQALRGAKLLRLTENAGSSRLGVKAALEMVTTQERLVIGLQPVRAEIPNGLKSPSGLKPPSLAGAEILQVPVGGRIRIRLKNKQSRPVYFLLFGLDNNGSTINICKPARVTISPVAATHADVSGERYSHYPRDIEVSQGARDETEKSIFKRQVIAPGETLVVPQAAEVEWAVSGPRGLVETKLIFSIAPFTQTQQVIAKSPAARDDSSAMLLNPLDVAQALLEDLHKASEPSALDLGLSTTDSFALDVNAWATLSFIYKVV